MLPCSRNAAFEQLNGLIRDDFEGHEVIVLPSARMGFYLTLLEMFKEGDEVIFPVLGFPLYVKIALQLGLRPRLVDVEPDHLNMDPVQLENAISKDTKGIVVTHLFGHPAKMDAIMAIAEKHDVPVIEDCAQSYDSFYRNQKTGTFGRVGIFSCSLMKVPTTLGGGILVTRDQNLARRIRRTLQSEEFSNSLSRKFPYLAKNTVSVLNSYPLLYVILTHHVFGFLRNRNPALLRKVLYSGMGITGGKFDVWERPRLAGYQLAVGIAQFSRTRSMTMIRRGYSATIDQVMADVRGVTILQESPDVFWNYQYHVVHIESGMIDVYNKMFERGYHLMQENVWDCSKYDFFSSKVTFPIGSKANEGLIRIPNNSLLNPKHIQRIAETLRMCCESV